MRLPKGCGSMSGKVVKVCHSLYGRKQASRQWHHHLVRGMMGLGFEQCEPNACVMRLVEAGGVSIVVVVVVHVDDIFAVGLKSRCGRVRFSWSVGPSRRQTTVVWPRRDGPPTARASGPKQRH